MITSYGSDMTNSVYSNLACLSHVATSSTQLVQLCSTIPVKIGYSRIFRRWRGPFLVMKCGLADSRLRIWRWLLMLASDVGPDFHHYSGWKVDQTFVILSHPKMRTTTFDSSPCTVIPNCMVECRIEGYLLGRKTNIPDQKTRSMINRYRSCFKGVLTPGLVFSSLCKDY